MRNPIESASNRIRQGKLLTKELRAFLDTSDEPEATRQVLITMRPNKWYSVERAINRTPRLPEVLQQKKEQEQGLDFNELNGEQIALVASPNTIFDLAKRWDIKSIIPDPPSNVLLD